MLLIFELQTKEDDRVLKKGMRSIILNESGQVHNHSN